MRRVMILSVAAVVMSAAARAGWVAGVERGEDFASGVGAFDFSPASKGLPLRVTAGDSVPMPSEVMLSSMTLTARRTKGPPGMNSAAPLYLKIYEGADRATLVGASREALKWNPDAGGVALGSEGTYRFTSVKLRRDATYVACFETAPGPVSPVGGAGLQVCSPSPVSGGRIYHVSMKPVITGKVPLFRLELAAPADAGFHALKIRHFSPGRWEEVKRELSAVPGVVRVSGKKTGEVLLVMKPGASLKPADVDAALGRVSPLARESLSPLSAAEAEAW